MSEQQLQFSIVTGFHNAFPEYRGMLLEINNSTNKGAYRKGMGLVKGASDLLFIGPSGIVYTFELKDPGSRHNVKHLKTQLNWSLSVCKNKKSRAFFIFSKEQFFEIMEQVLKKNSLVVDAMAMHTLSYIAELIDNKKDSQTVKMDYEQ